MLSFSVGSCQLQRSGRREKKNMERHSANIYVYIYIYHKANHELQLTQRFADLNIYLGRYCSLCKTNIFGLYLESGNLLSGGHCTIRMEGSFMETVIATV